MHDPISKKGAENMTERTFLKNYFDGSLDAVKRLTTSDSMIDLVSAIASECVTSINAGGKLLFAGNGGSAAIASHFSVDMTKNAGIRCINFNESDLLTCFSNDYGYDHWVEKSLQFYADAGDLIIIISSSGKSKNMINAVKFAKKKGHKVVTLTGFKKKNQVSKLGDLNFNINSKNYNQIENLHQFILLTMVDLLIYMK